MKKIVFQEQTDFIEFDKLIGVGAELISYRCANSDAYCILVQLEACKYGFVPLNNSNSDPRFVGRSWKDAVAKAATSRPLYLFKSMQSMLQAMVSKSF